jgi:hypothetical protein
MAFAVLLCWLEVGGSGSHYGLWAVHLARHRAIVTSSDRRIPALVALTGNKRHELSYMPELQWPVGYPAVIVVILVFSFVLHRLFVRNGWL